MSTRIRTRIDAKKSVHSSFKQRSWGTLWLLVAISIALVGSIAGAPPSAAQTSGNVGYRDFSYGTTCNSTPTGEKPESKLWWNDGSWWGSLCNPSTNKYHIYRLDQATQKWNDTGTVLDDRPQSKADTLWDNTAKKLYVASHLFTTNAQPSTTQSQWGRLYRYSYNASTKTYSLDAGFPVTVTKGTSETLVVDKDSTGKLWVTYVESGKVMLNRSLNGNDAQWGEPFLLPVTGVGNATVTSDDIASLISFGKNIGVMWSNQSAKKMFFAVHVDGQADTTWQAEKTVLPDSKCKQECADDHINLAALQEDSSGRVYAATKTSYTVSSEPLVMLSVRDLAGNWTSHVFGTVANFHTRPIVMLDDQQQRLYMFATAPEGGGAIHYKSTPLSNIQFTPGLGEVFIRNTTDTKINNATSTKQNVNSTTGLVVLASDANTRYYVHNYMSLGSSTPTATATPTSVATPTSTPTGGTSTTQTLAAEVDAYVDQNAPTSNYGKSTVLAMDAVSGAGGAQHAYLRFNLGGLTGTVQRATLRLYVSNASTNGPKLYAADSNSWTETGLTWNTKPDSSGTALGDTGNVAVGTWIEFDVTRAVTAGGSTSFVLIPDSSDGVDVHARENGSNQPQLVVATSGTSTPTNTPTSTTAPTNTATSTAVPTSAPTVTPTAAPTNVPTATATPTSVATPTSTPTGGTSTTQTLTAEVDAYVDQNAPTSNYGKSTVLAMDAVSGAGGAQHAYLRFNLGGLTGTVQRATLRLYVSNASTNGPKLYAADSNSWTETGLTWNTKPDSSGTALGDTGNVAVGSWIEFDVTRAVTAGGSTSFVLIPDSSDGVDVHARENGSNQPQLVVTTS